MMNAETYKKMQLGDLILANVMLLLHLTCNGNEQMVKILNNGVEDPMDWEDMDSLIIEPIKYNDKTYNQINIWGDGTVEFQDNGTDAESICWTEFSNEFLTEISSNLYESVKKMLKDKKDLETS